MKNISQTHTGSGDCIGGNKIVNQEMLNGATIKGSKIGSFTQSSSMGVNEDLIIEQVINDSEDYAEIKKGHELSLYISKDMKVKEVKLQIPVDKETLRNYGVCRKNDQLIIEFYDKDSVVFEVNLSVCNL